MYRTAAPNWCCWCTEGPIVVERQLVALVELRGEAQTAAVDPGVLGRLRQGLVRNEPVRPIRRAVVIDVCGQQALAELPVQSEEPQPVAQDGPAQSAVGLVGVPNRQTALKPLARRSSVMLLPTHDAGWPWRFSPPRYTLPPSRGTILMRRPALAFA